jgi:hypothetical protein
MGREPKWIPLQGEKFSTHLILSSIIVIRAIPQTVALDQRAGHLPWNAWDQENLLVQSSQKVNASLFAATT